MKTKRITACAFVLPLLAGAAHAQQAAEADMRRLRCCRTVRTATARWAMHRGNAKPGGPAKRYICRADAGVS